MTIWLAAPLMIMLAILLTPVLWVFAFMTMLEGYKEGCND